MKAFCGQEMGLKGNSSQAVLAAPKCLVNALTPQVRALSWAVMKNGFRRMAIGKINQIDSSLMTQIKS